MNEPEPTGVFIIVAQLPARESAVMKRISCELPGPGATAELETEFKEFVELAKELGAIALYREKAPPDTRLDFFASGRAADIAELERMMGLA